MNPTTGSAFEERLEAAASLDLSVIKSKLLRNDGAVADEQQDDSLIDSDPAYNKDLKQVRMTWSEVNELERRRLLSVERFQLNTLERLNFAFTCVLIGFAWGEKCYDAVLVIANAYSSSSWLRE